MRMLAHFVFGERDERREKRMLRLSVVKSTFRFALIFWEIILFFVNILIAMCPCFVFEVDNPICPFLSARTK